MSQADKFYRFIFEHDIRGELVCLSNSYQDAMHAHAYPEQVRALLECLAASVLLSGTLKFDGILSIQAKEQWPGFSHDGGMHSLPNCSGCGSGPKMPSRDQGAAGFGLPDRQKAHGITKKDRKGAALPGDSASGGRGLGSLSAL